MKTAIHSQYHVIARCLQIFAASLLAFNSAAEVFTIDPAQSTVSLSGAIIGYPIKEQGPGSLITKYAGTINADVTAAAITFTGSSGIIAQNSANWEPKAGGAAGNDPANYGGKASAGFLGSAVAAIRNAQFDVTSPPLALAGATFPSSALLFQFLKSSAGAIDYSVTGFLAKKGIIALQGYATNRVTSQATLVTSGNVQTLTIPIVADFFFDLLTPADTTLTIAGQLVATRVIGGGGTISFSNWVAAKFPGVTDTTVIGPAADADHDGIPNFVEYAFGLNPTAPDAGFAPLKAVQDPNNPAQGFFEFIRPKGLGGVTYLIQASTSLSNWSVVAVKPDITD